MLFIIPLFHSIALSYTVYFFHIFQLSKMVLKCNPAFQSDDPPSKLKISISGSLLSRVALDLGQNLAVSLLPPSILPINKWYLLVK